MSSKEEITCNVKVWRVCIKGRHWPVEVVLIGFADFNAFLSTGVSLPGLVIVGPRLAGASVNAVMPVSGGPPSRCQ